MKAGELQFAPAGFGSLNRGYVAMSRARWTSRIYAVTDNGWRDTLSTLTGHTPAIDQTPDPDHPLVQQLLARTAATDPRPTPEADSAGRLRDGSPLGDPPATMDTAGERVPARAQPPPATDDDAEAAQERPAPVTWLHPLPPEPIWTDDDAVAHQADPLRRPPARDSTAALAAQTPVSLGAPEADQDQGRPADAIARPARPDQAETVEIEPVDAARPGLAM